MKNKKTLMALLKEIATEIEIDQIDKKSFLFENSKYQNLTNKCNQLLSIGVTSALIIDTCIQMWKKMTKQYLLNKRRNYRSNNGYTVYEASNS